MDLPENHPHSLSPRGLAIAGWSAFALAGVAFIALAWNVAGHLPLVLLDASITSHFNAARSATLTAFMMVVTHAHSLAAISLLSVAFALALARLREWYWLLTLTLAVGGGMLLNWALKIAYERVRPAFDDPLLTLTTFSFPSGHTAAATLFYGVLAAFLVSRVWDRHWRACIVAAAVVAVATVAFSRVYLGAHYMSDVVAAACSSTAWLALCLTSVHALVLRKRKRA